MKYKKTFNKFLEEKDKNDKSLTDNYEPPKYLIQPQEGDKGFALVKSAFDAPKQFKYTPRISY